MANVLEATLHIIYVGEPLLDPHELLHTVGLSQEQLRGLVLEQAPGSPAVEIIRIAREWRGEAIVLCTHTGAAKPNEELGSTTEAVLHAAPCPVVVVQPRQGLERWAIRRILLPQDGTPTAAEAIKSAAELAHRATAGLDVLHVAASETKGSPESGTFGGLRYLDQPQHEWPVWADEFRARLRGLGHVPETLALRLFLARGIPGKVITRFATEHQSDLIVVAWRGHLEAERALTLKAVIAESTCPVFVIRVDV
jgi:nucleotide-binding universal stress UspA family protein